MNDDELDKLYDKIVPDLDKNIQSLSIENYFN
jgi:hypothetical protein